MAHNVEAAGLVVQNFADVLADLAQRAAAGLAVAAALNTRRWVMHDRAARQMCGQFAQSGTQFGRALLAGRLHRGDVAVRLNRAQARRSFLIRSPARRGISDGATI